MTLNLRILHLRRQRQIGKIETVNRELRSRGSVDVRADVCGGRRPRVRSGFLRPVSSALSGLIGSYCSSGRCLEGRGAIMASVKCPHCGAYTANEPVVVRGRVNPADRTRSPLDASYRITTQGISAVECMACELCFIVVEDRAVWPLTSPPAPDSVPEKVKEAYEDARLAYAAGAKIGALMAARTALVRFLRDKQVASLKELVEKQLITSAIYGGVDQLRLWAAIAGHDDIDVDTFDAQEVEDILDYLATALEAVYTHQARVDQYVRRTKELRNESGATSP